MAVAANCSPRTARRRLRRALGAGTTLFGAEAWPVEQVRALIARDLMRRNGRPMLIEPPDDDEGWR